MARKLVQILLGMMFVVSACTSPFVIATPPIYSTTTIVPTNAPTSTSTPKPTRTPLPTPIACPPEGTPLKVGNINIYFETDVVLDCDSFAKIIATANTWAKDKGEAFSTEVYIFGSEDSLLKFTQTWAPKVSCSPGGGSGTAYPSKGNLPSVVLINANAGGDKDDIQVVVHELTHTIQYAYYPSTINPCGPTVPSWVKEGHAQYESFESFEYWGLLPDSDDIQIKCKDKQLTNLIPSSDGCVWMMGYRAFTLLEHICGRDYSFELWKDFSITGNFEISFKKIYGMSTSAFETEYFNVFRDHQYILDPKLEESIGCANQ